MPGATSSSTEISAPRTHKRRAWVHPDVQSHSLMVLTPDQLHATPLSGPPKPDVVAAAEGGADLGELLGPLAVVVELSAVRTVKLDLLTNALVVGYAKSGRGTGRLTVVFATAEAADECFTRLWRRLGDAYRLRSDKRDAWAAARTPLALLAGALLVTAALAVALSVFEDAAPGREAARRGAAEPGASKRPAGPLDWVGWRGVCAAGGVAAAAAQVWLYRRLSHPPERLRLVRT